MSEIKGLKELRAELRAAGPEMAKRLQVINKRLAEDIAQKAKANFYSSVPGHSRSGPQRKSGAGSISRSRNSIRANASQTESKIVAGGPKAPGFFGHEFGGGARPRTRQFPVHKGREGYVLYPIVRRERDGALTKWESLFQEVFAEGGPR